ncbi:MAG TPA: tetratricopeptide repeat protein [Rhizomicrobium sp.]|nr:tetratricopeptide repeat protein [Rhizomicrobium sp.]
MRECFIAPLMAAALAVTIPTSAASAGPGDSQCGAEPNPFYSIESLIAACTHMARGTPEYMGPGIGMMPSAPPEARAQAYYHRGLYYQFSHRYDLAIADYTSATGWKRTYEDAYAARGDAYEDAGDHAGAASDYAQAASLRTDDAQDLNNRCWDRAMRGHPLDRALADCNASLKFNPDYPAAFDSRCLVNYRMGNYADAITDCSEALKQERQSPTSLYTRGLAKIRSGDTTGGNSDIAAAKDSYRQVEELFAVWGVKP